MDQTEATESLAQEPKILCENASPIRILHVDIMLLIFRLLDPSVEKRIILTHICREWRDICLQSPELWTDVHIITSRDTDSGAFNKFMARLSTQLSRTGDLPLDIVWISSGNEHRNERVRCLIDEMAPFHRWQSLWLRLDGPSPRGADISIPSNQFARLESFSVSGSSHDSITGLVNLTATSKLRKLDLRYLQESLPAFLSSYNGIINNISSIILPDSRTATTRVELPPNVVDLSVDNRHVHRFPYVGTYRVGMCAFFATGVIQLSNLTKLIIGSSLDIHKGCKVTLDSLLYLQCTSVQLGPDAEFHTPILETLHLYASYSKPVNNLRVQSLAKALQHPGFRPSPRASVVVDLCLEERTIFDLFRLIPHQERASLSFDDQAVASKTLASIFGGSEAIGWEEEVILAQNLAQKLTELQLNFEWAPHDVAFWKAWASSVVPKRKAAGIDISIRGIWKGDSFGILLA